MFALYKKLLLSLVLTSLFITNSFAEDFTCSQKPSGEYFAIVNGQNISIEEFNRIKFLVKSKIDTGDKKQYPKIISNFIKTILISKIVSEKAKEISLYPSEEQIREDIELFRKNQFNNSQYELDKYINKFFCSNDAFKDSIKEKLMVTNYLKYIEEKEFKITQKELDDNYKKILNRKDLAPMYRISYIMLKDKKTVKNIYKLLKKGNDFGTLAQKYSQDKETSKNKGDLGYFIKGMMIPEVEKQAEILKIGQYNKTVIFNKEQNAYFIVKKTGYKKEYDHTLDNFRVFTDENFTEQKRYDFFANYYDTLIKNSDIKYNTSLEEYSMLDKDIIR